MANRDTMMSGADAAETGAFTVLRLLAVGDIDIVWLFLHVGYRTRIVDDFVDSSSGRELLAAYGSRLHRAQFFNLARQRLLNELGPLPAAAAQRRARTVDMFTADRRVVLTVAIDDEPDRRWAIEMLLTDDGWRWHDITVCP